jgi:hypothetical protein
MTHPDYRALCAELIEAAEDMTVENDGSSDRFDSVAERARAALAQPEPPAEGEVEELVRWLRVHADEHTEERDGPYTRAADLSNAVGLPIAADAADRLKAGDDQ